MGANVCESLAFGQTHFVFSNGNENLIKAAQYMDIQVVSPLWILQCKEAKKKVPEKDFLVSSTFAGSRSNSPGPVVSDKRGRTAPATTSPREPSITNVRLSLQSSKSARSSLGAADESALLDDLFPSSSQRIREKEAGTGTGTGAGAGQ